MKIVFEAENPLKYLNTLESSLKNIGLSLLCNVVLPLSVHSSWSYIAKEYINICLAENTYIHINHN